MNTPGNLTRAHHVRNGLGYKRAAEGPAADVHDRMPVILPDDGQSAWIDPTQTDGKKALALAQEKTITAVEHYRVSQRVNNAKNQGAELIEPFESPA